MSSGQNPPSGARAGHFRRMGLAYLVLTLGLLTTWLVRNELVASAGRENVRRFDLEVRRTYAAMESRVNHYLMAVQHLQGLFHARESVSEEEWNRWLPSMNWRWQYPNLLEIGFAEAPGPDAPATVRHFATLGSAANFPVGSVLGGNAWELGAMRETTLSAQTVSAGVRDYRGSDGRTESAHLIFYPVYRGGVEPSRDRRPTAIRGYVFGLFRAGDLYSETLGSGTNLSVRLEVKDVTGWDAPPAGEDPPVVGETRRVDGRFERLELEEALGRTWSLRFTSLPSFRIGANDALARLVVGAGAALSLTIFAIVGVQAGGRHRALELGKEIRQLNDALERRIAERTLQLEKSNADLRSEVEDRRRAEHVQRATYQISEAVHTTEDLKNLYARIHSIIGALMPADNFFLLLHDPASDTHVYVHHVDQVDEWPAPRRITRGLVGYILRTGQPLLVDRVSMTDTANEWHFVSGTPSEIWLGVPLLVRGQTIGVMALQDYRNPRAYGETEKQILTFVAEQTALAIERKRAEASIARGEAELRASEERFRNAFHASPALMALTRFSDGKFVAVNAAFTKTFGYAEEEIIGRLAADLELYETSDQREEFRRLLQTHGVARDREHPMRTKDGSIRTLLISGEITVVDGEPHVLTAGQDITERKHAEQETLRALEKERELNELKSRFVSMVSHEFRTPLGIIMSAVELLQNYMDRLPAPKRTELLADIHGSTRRMAQLMEQALFLGRAEAGRLTLNPAPIDLAAVCQKLLDESLSATDARCPVELSVELLPGGKALGDEALLRHIFANLLSNAAKYSPAGQPVVWTVRRDGVQAVFRIVDRGIGIPAADVPRLFEAFHRAKNVGETPGTGLGLLIVKQCVEQHGGRIEVRSEEGAGTEVTVRLPLFLPEA